MRASLQRRGRPGAVAPALAVALSIVVSCWPTLPSDHVIEQFTYLGTRSEVTASDLQVFTAPGLTRGDFLPGETLRLTPYFADVDGVLEPGSVPVDWFLCWGECSLSGTGFEPCGELVPGQSERCHVGPSGVLDVKAGTKFTSAQLEEIIDGEQFALRYLRVALIAQDPRSNRVPSCRDRVLEGRRGEDLSDCQLARRTIHLGPPGPLILAAEQIGFALPEGLPPELAADLPNFNPKLQEFELIEALAGGGERRQHVAPSGVATVSVGSRVTVRPIVLEVDQTNHEFGSRAEEHNSLYWHVMHAHADALDVAADTGTVWSTRAPAVDLNASFSTDSPLASASPLHLAVTLADSREGEDVAWLRVEVAAQ